jgi:hypothetical protein
MEVCPLSREVMLPLLRRNLYPPHYRMAFAFSIFLYPQFISHPLRFAYPCRENYGLTMFRLNTWKG